MSVERGNGAVLIVATDRDDRRILFDALDAQEFEAIYTAKDISQARTFLEQDPQIDLVLLEFLGPAADAVSFCNELVQFRPLDPIPVIGLHAPSPDAQCWNWKTCHRVWSSGSPARSIRPKPLRVSGSNWAGATAAPDHCIREQKRHRTSTPLTAVSTNWLWLIRKAVVCLK